MLQEHPETLTTTCSEGHVNSAEQRFCICCGEALSSSNVVFSEPSTETNMGLIPSTLRGYKKRIQAHPSVGILCKHYAMLMRQRKELVKAAAGKDYSIICSQGHVNSVENRFCIHCGELLSLSPDVVSGSSS